MTDCGYVMKNIKMSLYESDGDVLSYARTITGKVSENETILRQVANNTKEQAMMGGFADAIKDAVIDSLDVHQSLATQVLSEESIKKGLANIVYGLIDKELNTSSSNHI